MIKPQQLFPGDKVATISLSWGGAGELPQRYQIGKQQLQETFDLQVVESKHALRPAKWLSDNPQARADDLMEALQNNSIKAIISNIGGEDSIRTLGHIDIKVIANNPKIFLGFSDSTITHFCFFKAGVVSFYGTSLMVGFAENGGMHQYQVDDLNRTLFSDQPVGEIAPNRNGWTSELLDWGIPDNQNKIRKLNKTDGWRFLQGQGVIRGKLLGGCLEVLEFLKGTEFWPDLNQWQGKVIFIETSEEMMGPDQFRWILRNYAAAGILQAISGLLVGRPLNNKNWQDYDRILQQVIAEEEGLNNLPIISGMDFGHTCPTFTLPYGIEGEINCERRTFSILENAITP